MKFAISIEDMTADEMATVSTFLTSMGAKPVITANPKTKQTVAELAALTGAGQTPPPPPPAPGTADPFAIAGNVQHQNASPVTQTPPPPPPPPLGGELDSRGLPHNPQFYADSKRTNKDGSWAKRKGVDAAACEAWERVTLAGKAGAGQTPPPPPPPVTHPPVPASPTPPPPPALPADHPSAAEVTAKFAPHLAGQPNGAAVAPSTAPAGISSDPFASVPPAPPLPPPLGAPEEEIPNVTYPEWHQLYMSLMTTGKLTAAIYTEIADPLGGIEDQMKFYNDAEARGKCYARFMTLANS